MYDTFIMYLARQEKGPVVFPKKKNTLRVAYNKVTKLDKKRNSRWLIFCITFGHRVIDEQLHILIYHIAPEAQTLGPLYTSICFHRNGRRARWAQRNMMLFPLLVLDYLLRLPTTLYAQFMRGSMCTVQPNGSVHLLN